MERRKIIIYSIFVIVAVYGFYYHFLSGETPKRTVTPVPVGDTMRANISVVEKNLTGHEIAGADEFQPSDQHAQHRNPFANKNMNQGKRPAAGVPVRYAKPSVSAISLDGSETFIIANDKIIKIGEKIGVWRLVKAESQRALFDGPNGTIWVSLGG